METNQPYIIIDGVKIFDPENEAFQPCYTARNDDLFANKLFEGKTTFLDVGTGSGILPLLWHKHLSAASERLKEKGETEKIEIDALDLELNAIAYARFNLERNDFALKGSEDGEFKFKHNSTDCTIRLIQSNMFGNLKKDKKYDIIVYNGAHCEPKRESINALKKYLIEEFHKPVPFRALFDPGFKSMLAFIKGLKSHLKDEGYAILTFSDYSRFRAHAKIWKNLHEERLENKKNDNFKFAIEDVFALLREAGLIATILSVQKFRDTFFLDQNLYASPDEGKKPRKKIDFLKLAGIEEVEVPLWYNILITNKDCQHSFDWVANGFTKAARKLTLYYSHKKPTKRLYEELKHKLTSLYNSQCTMLGSFLNHDHYILSGLSYPTWDSNSLALPNYILGAAYSDACKESNELGDFEKENNNFILNVRYGELSKEARLVIDTFGTGGLIAELESRSDRDSRFELLPTLDNDYFRLKCCISLDKKPKSLALDDALDRDEKFKSIENAIDTYIDKTIELKAFSRNPLLQKKKDIVKSKIPIKQVVRGVWLAFGSDVLSLCGKNQKYCSFVRLTSPESTFSETFYLFSTYGPKSGTEPQITEVFELLQDFAQTCHIAMMSVLLRYKREKHARRSAAATIMARNMAHNIGSHVMPQTRVDQLKERIESFWIKEMGKEKIHLLSTEKIYNMVLSLKNPLDDYIQRKGEFMAEITSTSVISSRSAFFFRNVIAPFLRNTTLMDALAADEGFGYSQRNNQSLIIRCFRKTSKGDKELRLFYDSERSTAVESCPTKLCVPYAERSKGNWLSSQDHEISNSDMDIRIALPGSMGEMAFYSILENIIRNSAKYGKSKTNGRDTLNIDIMINDFGSGEKFYLIEILDKCGPSAEAKETAKKLNRWLTEKDIIGTDEQIWRSSNSENIESTINPRHEARGCAEMAICASFLANIKEFIYNPDKPNIIVDSDEHGLKFSFKLSKAKTAIIVGFDLPNQRKLEKFGFLFFNDIDALIGGLENMHILPGACQFALINSKFLTGDIANYSRILPILPFRIILVGDKENISEILTETAVITAETPPFENGHENLEYWLWQIWTDYRWGSKEEKKHKIKQVVLSLQQDKSEKPTEQYIRAINSFNSRQVSIRKPSLMHMVDRDDEIVTTEKYKSDSAKFIIDRHANLARRKVYPIRHSDSWISIDKNCLDYDSLWSPDFSDPWTLPYQLLEAARLKVLIIDERLAKISMARLSGNIQNCLLGREDKQPVFWHQAHRSGVSIVLHLNIKFDSKTECFSLAETAFTELKKSANSESVICPDFIIDGNFSRREKRLELTGRLVEQLKEKSINLNRFDVAIIHQGILDKISGVGRNAAQSFISAIKNNTQWLVIESGRGIPLEVQSGQERFISFSVIERVFRNQQVAKVELTQRLMELTRSQAS